MKTTTEIKERIKIILSSYIDKDDKEIRKLRKEKEFLDVVLKYLETEPNEAFLIKERDRIQNRLDLIAQGFTDYAKQNTNHETDNQLVLKMLREQYNKEFDITSLNRQIKTIRFILNR